MGYTVFQDCDLRATVGLEQARHDAPSTIGVDTIYRSGGLIPAAFLAGAGVPGSIASFQEIIAAAPPALSECYISCRDEDEEFARDLSNGLSALGVSNWVFSQRVRGSALVSRLSSSDQEEVERWLRNYDKLIIVASARALDTEAILNDITAARNKQQSADRWLLYFVAPDNGLMRPGSRAAATWPPRTSSLTCGPAAIQPMTLNWPSWPTPSSRTSPPAPALRYPTSSCSAAC